MRKKTIIVGAGMAGIMAARTLLEAGLEVIVLEARERIGGRIWTNRSFGTAVDMGAAWIHGPVGNPITFWQEQLGVASAPDAFEDWQIEVTQAYDAEGRQLDMKAFDRGRWLAEAELRRQGASLLTEPLPASIRSIQQMADYCLGKVSGLTEVERQAFVFQSTIIPTLDAAADAHELDRYLSDDYVALPGVDQFLFGGYDRIINHLAEGLPIKTGVCVEEVRYGARGVEVQTTHRRWYADYVVVTVPLGVLKAGQIGFVPPLPAAHQKAIEHIGFGVAEKIILEFDNFYWPKQKERFFVSSNDGQQYFSAWINAGMYSETPILASYQTGQHALDFNQWSDEEALERAMALLQKMFGPLPAPLKVARTRWQRDAFSRGSYSYERIGQQPADRLNLSRPVAQRLFFAGEATHPAFMGTVHGAYETGIHVAQKIIEQTMYREIRA